jgi:hypothetical protein
LLTDFSTGSQKPQMNTDQHRYSAMLNVGPISNRVLVVSVFICFYLWLILLTSCSSKPSNLRALAPADTLVYLETNDLGGALQPIVDNKVFEQVAKKKPDLSSLHGMQLAIVVTGFETREEKVTEENSVGRIQPHFAAIADTHAWSWQAKSFAENQLGELINNVYGGGINLDTAPKNGGTYYVWTAEDGRKAYAFVDGSLIFFGNDESSIDKCLAVKRGEADSILKNPKLPAPAPNALASGYVSTDGVAQIANIIGLAMAAGIGEEEQVKSFIAGVLPQLIRSSLSDVSWTATKTEQGIEDKWLISTAPDVSNVFSETLAPSGNVDTSLFEFLPVDMPSVTLYNLNDPQIAWRSVLLVALKQTDSTASKILTGFSGGLFEPYGIRDAETFLSAVGPNIATAKFDLEGENPVVIASIKDKDKIKRSLTAEIKPNKQASDELGVEIWKSADAAAAAFIDDKVIAGDADNVIKCVRAKLSGNSLAKTEFVKQIKAGTAPSVTFGNDQDSAPKIADALSDKKGDDAKAETTYIIETRFTKNGIERRTVSDFGLIGSIIAQLAPED